MSMGFVRFVCIKKCDTLRNIDAIVSQIGFKKIKFSSCSIKTWGDYKCTLFN